MICFNRCNKPIIVANDCYCGIKVTSTCSSCCTRLCCQVTYTVTIENTSTCTLNNACLHVPLDGVFCLDTSSITVNGESVTATSLDNIPIGTIATGETATVVYSVTVMQYKRYINTKAALYFYVCCCCQRKDFIVLSNCNCLQCCPCCCNSTSTT